MNKDTNNQNQQSEQNHSQHSEHSHSRKKGSKKSFSQETNPTLLHKGLGFTAREQYKVLRTNLSFSLPDNEGCNIIGVTSSMRGDGKSTTAINLAYVLAEDEKKVLLIDGDLRLPSVAKKLGIKKSPGVSNILNGTDTEQMSVYKTNIHKNLFVLPSGDIPPNPSELLGSNKMKNLITLLADSFDYIIVDLPPVNEVTDALAISPLLSGIVLVAREGYTEKSEFQACVRQLELAEVKILGMVFNATTVDDKKYKHYSKYKKYRYGYYKRHRHYYYYYQRPEKND